jgi:hypothetical protein
VVGGPAPASASGPSEAGAYDRFLRQRARRARRVAATSALGLAVLLALVATLPGQRWGGDDSDKAPALGQAPTPGGRPAWTA